MYQKRKKVNNNNIDQFLLDICKDFLVYNDEAEFIISKKYRETVKGDEEIKNLPVILCTVPLEELYVPSCYSLQGDYLTTWCDSYPLIKMIYSGIKYSDGEIKNKHIDRLYLEIEKDEEFKAAKVIKNKTSL